VYITGCCSQVQQISSQLSQKTPGEEEEDLEPADGMEAQIRKTTTGIRKMETQIRRKIGEDRINQI